MAGKTEVRDSGFGTPDSGFSLKWDFLNPEA
jgi:hypothetical protein